MRDFGTYRAILVQGARTDEPICVRLQPAGEVTSGLVEIQAENSNAAFQLDGER